MDVIVVVVRPMRKPTLVVVDYVIVGIIAISALMGLVAGFRARSVFHSRSGRWRSFWRWRLPIGSLMTLPNRTSKAVVEVRSRVCDYLHRNIGRRGLLCNGCDSGSFRRRGSPGADRLIGLVVRRDCAARSFASSPSLRCARSWPQQPWWQNREPFRRLGEFESDLMTAFSSVGEMVRGTSREAIKERLCVA